MSKIVTPFKVGLVTVASLVTLFWAISELKKGADEDEGVLVYAIFRDASGLVPKSRVVVAGINVGEIDRIELAADLAKVWLRIRADLHTDASVMRKQASLLGDYYLRLFPGTSGKQLQDGDRISKVVEDVGANALIEQLERISGDIARVTTSVEKVLGGEQGRRALQEFVDNLNATTRAIRQSVAGNQGAFDSIVTNLDGITTDVAGFTGSAGRSVDGILREVHQIVRQVNGIIGRSKGDVDESVGSLKETLTKLERTLDELSVAVQNVSSITAKIDEGKGTVGALVNDDHLAQGLDRMVDDAGEFVHTLTGMQTIVGLRGEYNFGLNSLKNTLSLRFQPREDKYYLIEIVDDPRGSTSVSRRTLESQDPAKHQIIHETETLTTDQLKFSLQFAKEYHFLTGRFGIIENTGGFGGNARLFDDRLDVQLDMFDFGADRYPRLRMRAAYEFFRHMYFVGGFDDVLNLRLDAPGETLFLGAGLRFTDDDLKALLTTVPSVSF